MAQTRRVLEEKMAYRTPGRVRCFRWLSLVSALLIPGSGYVFLGRPMRGLVMLFWMIIFAYLTFHFSSPDISFIGRISGGIAVWVLSVAEVYRISKHLSDPEEAVKSAGFMS